MTKFPYITEYKIFERVDFPEAEEALRDYNDFFMYNLSQYNDIFKKSEQFDIPTSGDDDDEKAVQLRLLRAEQNAKAATDHFTKLFGSKDFAESSLIGLKISWYDLQQLLLEEFRSKTPAGLSVMNHIAPRIRNVASALLFAESIVSRLEKMKKTGERDREFNKQVDITLEGIREFFLGLLEILAKEERDILPEFSKTKHSIVKLKTPDALIEFCKKNLGIC